MYMYMYTDTHTYWYMSSSPYIQLSTLKIWFILTLHWSYIQIVMSTSNQIVWSVIIFTKPHLEEMWDHLKHYTEHIFKAVFTKIARNWELQTIKIIWLFYWYFKSYLQAKLHLIRNKGSKRHSPTWNVSHCQTFTYSPPLLLRMFNSRRKIPWLWNENICFMPKGTTQFNWLMPFCIGEIKCWICKRCWNGMTWKHMK